MVQSHLTSGSNTTRKRRARLTQIVIHQYNQRGIMKNYFLYLIVAIIIQGCGTLDNKTILINAGDEKQKVVNIMGVPYDRQFKKTKEAWQYCVSGAGFGYNDHKIILFTDGRVTGITTYRTSRSGCTGAVKTIRWEDAPDYTVEIRNR